MPSPYGFVYIGLFVLLYVFWFHGSPPVLSSLYPYLFVQVDYTYIKFINLIRLIGYIEITTFLNKKQYFIY
ncbi:hypothetical protein D3C74_318260 [compost metagenome]